MIKYPAVIVGAQYGDEGKGKVTDILAENADYVVRYQGGNNAGHTVVVKSETFKLHLMPSGVIHKKKCMLANGVVLDPKVLLQELLNLEDKGIEADLVIDPLTSIILPYHNLLDGISESSLKEKMIGTTKRGIGPAYEDKYVRRGIRFIDLLNKDVFRRKLHENSEYKRKIVEKVFGLGYNLDEEKVLNEYIRYGEQLKKYLGDVSNIVYENIDKCSILFESAQGTFLDIVYGTYPFVTSSHPISGSVFADVGFPPRALNVIGIVKAYTTRVGSGPFLSELTDAVGENIRKQGNEYGTTTGRPRRCGWLDLVMLKYSARLNGFSSLAITKLDVLSGLKTLKVAVKYSLHGKEVDFPLTIEQLEHCKVEYKEFEGFEIDTKIRNYDTLDKNAKKYLNFIESYLKVPISIISIGPKRSETIFRGIK